MKPIIALQHVPHEGLGLLENIFRKRGLAYQIVDVANNSLRLLHPSQLSGLVVLGGPMNVDEIDRYPFLAAEVSWIKQALAAKLPILGICLGAQLLAKSLGANVYANPIKEIGWYRLTPTPAAANDALFADCADSLPVFQWHGDTYDLPAQAVLLASSEHCRNQAFRYGSSAYGLQFHIEVTADMIAQWLREPGNCGELSQLPHINPQQISAETPQHLPAMSQLGHTILGRWADLCVARS